MKGKNMEAQVHSNSTVKGYSYTQEAAKFSVIKRNGASVPFEVSKIRETLERAVRGYESTVSVEAIIKEVVKNIYDGVSTQEIEKAVVLAAASFIEFDPDYDIVAKRLLLQRAHKIVIGSSTSDETLHSLYQQAFIRSIKMGVEKGVLEERLLDFDLERLAQALVVERDDLLNYLGLQTLFDRYFYKLDKVQQEVPQGFWMRVAMGLAINEQEKEERALEFYHIFSSLRYVSSTPTLFHSGYKIPQLSSCYLSTIGDDLSDIFKCIGDNAQLSKWAGGIGNDWTSIRGTGSVIKKIHATSQGVIPFMKLANDVVVAITRSGIRRGGTCGYLETWHLDIEDFLDLRRNTGDERRRTHDMNTANWIPDLFMQRMLADKDWTLFSPDETPDLHELTGRAFKEKYEEYEALAAEGKVKQYRTVSALKLWRKMLTRLFETGHPWITFKDPCNVRSPQDHVGVVHSSNLCTEITLNTSAEETAVCNLGSINLARHISDGDIDEALLAQTITTAIRMLDNVIDLNFYPTKEAKNSNMRHRPIGLGMMGFQDVLFQLNIPFSSDRAITFADKLGEMYSYYAILASSELARERGTYSTYQGSKWERGLFPFDTVALLEKERGESVNVNRDQHMNWEPIRERVKKWGMRNSNVMAIAPTATISNIAGCYPSIEPIYRNLYVKSNITGEFTIVNKYLVADLKKLGLWDKHMLEQLKYYDGDITMIEGIPAYLKEKYLGAFELEPAHLLKITAARAKWIDQSQSYNVFMKGVSGKKLHEVYTLAWKAGMKTTYYCRTLGASQIEKATLDAKYGFTQKREYEKVETQQAKNENDVTASGYTAGVACNPFDEECESCQ